MKIGTVALSALLAAPILIAALSPHQRIDSDACGGYRSVEGIAPSSEPIPFQPPSAPPGPQAERDLLFRYEDRSNFYATHPFLTTPGAPVEIRSPDEYARFLRQLRNGMRHPDDYERLLRELRSEIRNHQALERSARYRLMRHGAK